MNQHDDTLPAPLTGLAGLLGLPTFLEARVSLEWWSLLNDAVWHRGEILDADSRPVLLVPGFMATEASMAPMRRWLRQLGLDAEIAPVGLNAGPSARVARVVLDSVRRMAAEAGQRVVVIGHSRGGQHGTVAAVRAPEAVEAVVTLGSPLRAAFANHLLTRLPVQVLTTIGELVATASQRAEEAAYERDLLGPFPAEVRRVSIWSKTDGIVDWRLSVVHGARNVQVVGSHIGLSCNAQVYRALVSILERPAQRVGRRTAQAVVEEPTSEAPWTDVLQRRAFRTLNAVVRPAIQRGFGTPCLAPWGLVVLEHTGRRTGRTYESPLLALRLGRRVMVTTYRKDRSQWVRNLEEQPETHLWLDGRRKPYRALVLPGDTEPEEAKARIGHRLWQGARALLAAGFAVSVLEPV